MLSIYICDDNLPFLEHLKKIIQNIMFMYDMDIDLTLTTSDPYAILSKIEPKLCPGIYFLDVDLQSEINGIELAASIRQKDPRGFIVFITSHAEATPLTFQYKVEAMDYIIKEDMEKLSKQVYSCLSNALTKYSSPQNTYHKTLEIKIGTQKKYVSLVDIISVHSSDIPHKSVVYTTTGMFEMKRSLKSIKQDLDDNFTYCHKSCIVNRSHIIETNPQKRSLTTSNGQTCPISHRCLYKFL